MHILKLYSMLEHICSLLLIYSTVIYMHTYVNTSLETRAHISVRFNINKRLNYINFIYECKIDPMQFTHDI